MTPKNTPKRRPFSFGETPPLNSPLIASVAFSSKSPDQIDAVYDKVISGSTYAREGHPNSTHLAEILNDMEAASVGLITGSGMGAISVALFGLLGKGDHLVAGKLLYGGTLRLFEDIAPRFGIDITLVDPGDAKAFAAAIQPNTKMIFLETISNPTIRIADLHGAIECAKNRGILVMVDNTFTTPIGCQPLVIGADIVMHSVTKLLAGHADAMLGYVGVKNPDLFEPIYTAAITMGMTPSPFDCWLAERGLLSFALRYERSEKNAQALARHLSTLPGVSRVHYPALGDHPDHNLASKLIGEHSGTMLSFEIEGGRDVANRLFEAIDPIRFVATLGDISTTLSHPLSTSHRSITAEQADELGLTQGFFRVSVGVEDIDFLSERFTQAVKAAVSAR